ncbi:MAG: hypothetical protein PHU81_07460 [Acidobacteriota bacterium]|nr:hypothetical protein [Acidobacteriota bacterium]
MEKDTITLFPSSEKLKFSLFYFPYKLLLPAFGDLSRLVRLKFGVDEKYDYNLKISMVYFDDAEPELESIIMIDKSGEFRPIKDKEWQDIKDFFIEFNR